MRPLRTLGAAVASATVLATAACNANAPGGLSNAAAKVLRPAVENIRQTAASGTYAELTQAVSHLQDLVQQEEQAGEVSAQRATAIEDAADALLQDARPSPSPTPSSESPTPTPTPTTESPTPTPTSESPSPTPTPTSQSPTPIVSVSAL